MPPDTGSGAGSWRLGVGDAAKPAVIAALAVRHRGPVFVLTATPARSRALCEELPLFLDDLPVWRLPEEERLPYEFARDDPDTEQERTSALSALAKGATGIVVASWTAAALRCAPPSTEQESIEVAAGRRLEPAGLASWLEEAGYRNEAFADSPGVFARHGGLMDIFPVGAAEAVRVEFEGDRVETVRGMDVRSQRSTGLVDSCPVPALATSTSIARAAAAALADRLKARGERAEAVMEQLESVATGNRSPFAGYFEPLMFDGTALDHVAAGALLIADEPGEGEETIASTREQTERARTELEDRGLIPSGLPPLHADAGRIRRGLRTHGGTVWLERFGANELGAERLPFGTPPAFAGRLNVLAGEVGVWAHEGRAVVICSQQSLRIAEILDTDGVSHELTRRITAPPGPGTVTLAPVGLAAGLTGGADLVVISDAEIFGFRKRRRPTRTPRGARIELVASISPGDYLVHSDHGIARFAGVVRRSIDNIEREYLELQYAEGDRLYVPADQLESVTRYVGPTDRPPSLTRLGSGEWLRTRRRTRQAVAEMAHELLDLYARRELAAGHAFSPDTPWQAEVEAAFPFLETGDQLAAIREVKADMERKRPMDRLICGDVGYGKTEVAIRAAFKAVMDGRQVAVLVPTTVLAEQHGATFRERMAGFPVRVDVLSRFRSAHDQRQIIEAIQDGTADVVVGTHRLLGKDVHFKDLGLVIVDEEQRFGVIHKDRLKEMRAEVDVLTLSATPIPRTLQMALSGVRDMSTVMTPPEERLPIRTYVTGWDDEIVREAITRELQRGGQVYFVHNRVQSIERVLARLRRIVPEADVAIGHGQMAEEQLERVMVEFAGGDYDVLLCTTIIESGLDIPNVNTIIIDEANKLGLAQLYQLRGRVGRAANRAFAYLLFDSSRTMTEQAQRRLEAIFEATELGAGFQIALRDLEIRGAGNLLGTQQSGHIAAVGLELYTRLLGEAVSAMRRALGEEPDEQTAAVPVPIIIDVPLSAYIPTGYIGDLNIRLATYERIAALQTAEEITGFQAELLDRFGPLPPAVESLLYVALIRGLGRRAGVQAISTTSDTIHVQVRDGLRGPQRARVEELKLPGVRIGPEQARIDRLTHADDWMQVLIRILRALDAVPEDAPVPA
ncbi:MAG: transcription-repair coupling factor [Dehalococcoidia bacterium]